MTNNAQDSNIYIYSTHKELMPGYFFNKICPLMISSEPNGQNLKVYNTTVCKMNIITCNRG